MVFRRNSTPRQHRPNGKGKWCNTSSIGSTFSRNSVLKCPEIARETEFMHSTNEWYVGPSGGAKARSNNKDHHPHPCCRYDEHKRYLTPVNSVDITPPVRPNLIKLNISNSTDNYHPMLKNKRNENNQTTAHCNNHIQSKQKKDQAASSAIERTPSKILEALPNLKRTNSSTSNNSRQTRRAYDETTHHSSNTDT
jgi:hypothetical protein